MAELHLTELLHATRVQADQQGWSAGLLMPNEYFAITEKIGKIAGYYKNKVPA